MPKRKKKIQRKTKTGKVLHLLTTEEFDPIGARLEWLDDELYKFEEGVPELDMVFQRVREAYVLWQYYVDHYVD